MKQYCRYCNNLVTGNGTYCTAKNKEMRDSTAKSVNHCKQFEFNEMDAFFETDGYKPRSPKRNKPKPNREMEKAIKMLFNEYEKAKKQEWVKKPLAYALYQVWKMADRSGVTTMDKKLTD